MEANILNIGTGSIRTYGEGGKEFKSAYVKDNFYNFIDVDQYGISTDNQADKEHHGGVDKAIHIASAKHIETFKSEYDKELGICAMGQNILIDNYDENDICIGDQYLIGDILVEVTQPRQPCWKIGAIFGKEVNKFIVKEFRTGWYVRVLVEGTLDINDTVVLHKRVSDITIKELSVYLFTPPKNQAIIEQILNTESLAKAYKDDFLRVLSKN